MSFKQHLGPWLPSLIAWFVLHPTEQPLRLPVNIKTPHSPQNRSCRHKRDTGFSQLNLGSMTSFLKPYCWLISPPFMSSLLPIPLLKWWPVMRNISSGNAFVMVDITRSNIHIVPGVSRVSHVHYLFNLARNKLKIRMIDITFDASIWFQMASWATLPVVVRHKELSQVTCRWHHNCVT